MIIEKYTSSNCQQMAQLFYETVHTINAKHYTEPQLNAWATGNLDLQNWNKAFLSHYTLVAKENGKIVGFGDINSNGYLDRLYVHKNYQSMEIATKVLSMLENQLILQGVNHFTTHASITAKPFFEKRGYKLVRENKVMRNEIELTNYIMEKTIVLVKEGENNNEKSY